MFTSSYTHHSAGRATARALRISRDGPERRDAESREGASLLQREREREVQRLGGGAPVDVLLVVRPDLEAAQRGVGT